MPAYSIHEIYRLHDQHQLKTKCPPVVWRTLHLRRAAHCLISCCVGLEQHRDMGLTIDRCTALNCKKERWELLIAYDG